MGMSWVCGRRYEARVAPTLARLRAALALDCAAGDAAACDERTHLPRLRRWDHMAECDAGPWRLCDYTPELMTQ